MKNNRMTKLIILLLSLCLLAGCGTSGVDFDLTNIISATADPNEPKQDTKPFLDAYVAMLVEYNFGGCYATINPETKEVITLVDFAQRYENIFDAINLSGLSISYGNLEVEAGKRYLQSATLTYQSPVLGDFTQDIVFSMDYSSKDDTFYLNWTPSMIFTNLTSSTEVRLRTLRPTRGEIIDSDHNTYAINSYAESVYIEPSKVEDESYAITALASILSMTAADVEKVLKSSNAQKYDSAVVKVFAPGGISEATESALCTIPGVGVDRQSMTPIRYYPHGSFFAHSLGYASAITAEEMKTLDSERYDISSSVGRTGLEAAYEDVLCGTKGYSLDIYTTDGQRLTTVARKEKIDGLDLEITLDYDLQSRAETLLETMAEDGNAGAVVVMNPTTGEILASSSFPDFNPNLFVVNSDPDTLASYVSTESNSPLYNRAVQGSYIPGSTIKPLMAAMSLDEDVIDENYEFKGKITDKQWIPSGYWPYPPITRVSNYSGAVNMSNAITESDNIYFANLALQSGWDKVEPFLKKLGFDERIPFDLRVSSPSYMNKTNYENKQLLAATGYGQGELLSSPLQLTSLFSCLANNGDIMTPRLVKATRIMQDSQYAVVEEKAATVWKDNVISQNAVDTIVPMLHRVVQEGTGKKANIEGLTISGKTGTAEIGTDKTREIAWFLAFVQGAEYDRLVCVTLELPSTYEGTLRYDLIRELLMP